MSNNWTSTKKFDEKKRATQAIINYIPNVCDGHIVLMPSNTCYDIKEMKSQNKINSSTTIHIVDNLACNELKGKREEKIVAYKESCKKRFREIMGNDELFINNQNNFILGKNIQDFPLLIKTFDKSPRGCDFIYADTCGTYTRELINWIGNVHTVCSLKEGGIFAITILLVRNETPIEGNNNCPMSNPDLLLFGKNKEKNANKLYIIANQIEEITRYLFKSKALIYYEDYYKSPMGTLIFQKQ